MEVIIISIFIDTGIFVAHHNVKDERHEVANSLISRILEKEYGTAFTSSFILDESITLALVRTNNYDVSFDIGDLILNPAFNMIYINEKTIEKSWALFQSYQTTRFSFTDITNIQLIQSLRIECIASFDSDFDGTVTRIFE